MPTLIQNYKKKEVVNKLKTTFSLIQNAVRMSEVKYGETSDWQECNNTGSTSFECSKFYFETYIAPELKILKTCVPSTEECWASTKNLSGSYDTFFAGNEPTRVSAILNNGTSICVWDGGAVSHHMQLWFDLNGPNKGPNQFGADVFGLVIQFRETEGSKKGVFIHGLSSKTYTVEELKTDAVYGCDKNNNTMKAGRNCGALIQANGWEIPDDYPIKF